MTYFGVGVAFPKSGLGNAGARIAAQLFEKDLIRPSFLFARWPVSFLVVRAPASLIRTSFRGRGRFPNN